MAISFIVSGIVAQNVSLTIEADTEQDALVQFRQEIADGYFTPLDSRIVETSLSVEVE
jgi:hypothetical protein